MNHSDLKELMTFNKGSRRRIPLFATNINGEFILAAYQGTISEYDILIKYRKRIGGKWSRIRTPKHIHWTVDILIKMHSEKVKPKNFWIFY